MRTKCENFGNYRNCMKYIKGRPCVIDGKDVCSKCFEQLKWEKSKNGR